MPPSLLHIVTFLLIVQPASPSEAGIDPTGAQLDLDRDDRLPEDSATVTAAASASTYATPSLLLLDLVDDAHLPLPPSGVTVHQLLSGRDHARPSDARDAAEAARFRLAVAMQNYQYLIVDDASGDAVVVDGNYDPPGIARRAAELGARLVGYVATHYHWDHIGVADERGIDGLRWFVDGPLSLPAYIAGVERDEAIARCNVSAAHRLLPLSNGSTVRIGGREGTDHVGTLLRFLSTPGHSPGGTTILVGGHAITGDTLFPGSCGRIDLPESNLRQMYNSLQVRCEGTLVCGCRGRGARRGRREGVVRGARCAVRCAWCAVRRALCAVRYCARMAWGRTCWLWMLAMGFVCHGYEWRAQLR